MDKETQNQNGKSFKIPLWQLGLIGIVILAIAGGLVYHFVIGRSANYMESKPTSPSLSTTGSTTPGSANIYLEKTSAANGTYLTDFQGKTLYTYSQDNNGVSNCTGACATIWPPYTSATAEGTFPTNINVITRSDGTKQFTWKGMPLYYYFGDRQPGQINGNGVGGFQIVKP